MRVRFFGRLGDMVGREVQIDVPQNGCTVGQLRELLASQYPEAAPDLCKPSVRACVRDMIVGEQFVIEAIAEVEFFPPLSGG